MNGSRALAAVDGKVLKPGDNIYLRTSPLDHVEIIIRFAGKEVGP